MNNNDPSRDRKPEVSLHLVEKNATRTPREIEAYHIAPLVRQMIADEFRVMKSSRRLAKKHGLPLATVQDILHLCQRKEPQSETVRAFIVRQQRA